MLVPRGHVMTATAMGVTSQVPVWSMSPLPVLLTTCSPFSVEIARSSAAFVGSEIKMIPSASISTSATPNAVPGSKASRSTAPTTQRSRAISADPLRSVRSVESRI